MMATLGNAQMPDVTPRSNLDNTQIVVTSSSLSKRSCTLGDLVTGKIMNCATKSGDGLQFIAVHFVEIQVMPTFYTLARSDDWKFDSDLCFANWMFERSHDGISWDVLRDHTNEESLRYWEDPAVSFPVYDCTTFYSWFRISVCYANHDGVDLGAFEVFGEIIGCTFFLRVVPETTLEFLTACGIVPVLDYLHDEADAMGHADCVSAGLVSIRTSKLRSAVDSDPASDSALALVTHKSHFPFLTFLTCESEHRTFIELDFSPRMVQVDVYQITPAGSGCFGGARHWCVHGQNSAGNQRILRRHRHDTKLNKRGKKVSFAVSRTCGFFEKFIVALEGANADGEHILAIGALELFGSVVVPGGNHFRVDEESCSEGMIVSQHERDTVTLNHPPHVSTKWATAIGAEHLKFDADHRVVKVCFQVVHLGECVPDFCLGVGVVFWGFMPRNRPCRLGRQGSFGYYPGTGMKKHNGPSEIYSDAVKLSFGDVITMTCDSIVNTIYFRL